MEVHHHSHTADPGLHRGKKKWTHYFWEFLMLFLAVFCGFFAENQREHMIEHKREKQYIHSLVQDVGKDTANVSFWISLYHKLHAHCDTVLTNFTAFAKNESTVAAENFSKVIFGFPDFIYTDHTMQQLKNAGALRLIRNKVAIDSIIAYDALARDVTAEETAITHYYLNLNDLTNKLLSYRRMNDNGVLGFTADTLLGKKNYWITTYAGNLEELYNMVFKYRMTIKGFVDRLGAFKERGDRLMNFLKKEYRIK